MCVRRLRNALLALLVLLCASPASAQYTLIGQDYEECNTSAATCTFGTGVSAAVGDLVVVLISNRDIIGVSSIADGVNSGYTCPADADFIQASAVRSIGCYYINSGSGTVTPVITWASNSRAHANFQVWRPTGTVTFDAAVEGGNTAATTHVTPTLSTSADAALVLCGIAYQGAFTETPGTGYTALTNLDPSRWSGQYDITSVSSGSFTCDTTTASAGSAAIAMSFNDVVSAGGGPPLGSLGLLGVGR